MMSSLDATLKMPEAEQKLQTHHYMNTKLYTPLPALHVCLVVTAGCPEGRIAAEVPSL